MMPIKLENKGRYPHNWKEISKRIKERAGNKCEVCGIRNGEKGYRTEDGSFYSLENFASDFIPSNHETELGYLMMRGRKPITIVLTTAHLDHTPENCNDDNLKAMCKKCHNNYDKEHREKTRKETRFKQQTKLF